jgi:outer membrane protein TolC
MGMDMAYNIKVMGNLADYQQNLYDNVLNTNASLENNSTLRTLDLQTEALKQALDVQKAAWFPTLALTANYNWTSMNNGAAFKNLTWNPYSTVGVTFSIPLSQGARRYNKQKQAEISYREMTWQRENLENSLKLQVQAQFDNIQKSVSQIETNKAGVEQAVKANQIMEKSFRIGAASYLDLRDSENSLMSARLAYYQSIYNYLVAQSNLSYVLGNTDLNKYNTSK